MIKAITLILLSCILAGLAIANGSAAAINHEYLIAAAHVLPSWAVMLVSWHCFFQATYELHQGPTYQAYRSRYSAPAGAPQHV